MQTFKLVLYLLAILTSTSCTVLLFQGYYRKRVRLRLWSALCFAGLTLNNALVFVDLVILPQIDLRLIRLLAALGGMALMLYGFIWDSD